MSIFSGIFFHAVGATSASVCYTPQKSVKNWSWQSFWLVQTFFCWFLLPIVGAWLTIPQLSEVLQQAPSSAMIQSFLLGSLYGIGGTAFGLSINHLGFSLTYAIAVGISCVLGTLLPPWVHGELGLLLSKSGSGWIFSGVAMGAAGIALCGFAGRQKEKDLEARQEKGIYFSLRKGLPLAIVAGVLSAVYGFSLAAGQPIADVAAKHGAGHLQGNVIYIFSNTGAFLTSTLYCLYLHFKNGTLKEYRLTEQPGRKKLLITNLLLSFLSGLLWYSQFFFYGLGHTRMGNYQFSSWAIHMIMLVLFSSLVGLSLREWHHTRKYTRNILLIALMVLIAAVIILTYGNYLGDVSSSTH